MSELTTGLGGTGWVYRSEPEDRSSPLERELRAMLARLSRIRRVLPTQVKSVLAQVEDLGRELESRSDAELAAEGLTAGLALRRNPDESEMLRIFALVREAAHRRLGMRHHDTQLMGGLELLKGRLVEMDTGEGKTLTATLPATAAALAGVPVHIVTVNDYLAQRDAEQMAPVYELFGLRVGLIQEGMGNEERRLAYASDVTYVTNKQLAFDFLRDRLTLGEQRGELRLRMGSVVDPSAAAHALLLRGLTYAIVDEADSVLIDEARTPLILSASQELEEASEMFQTALRMAAEFVEEVDYLLRASEWIVSLTDSGRERLAREARSLGGLWGGRRRREELLTQALLALHVFTRDDHYIVREGKIQVVDEYTGRVMADRAWGRGIQQLLETKEGCEMTALREPLARISYQRFFRRYLHLSGMTGTAAEVASELRATYALGSSRIPNHRPLQRRFEPAVYCATLEAKWDRVAERVAELHAAGRPVLVGTRSVASSGQASEALATRGVPCCVLSATQDSEEAEIVAAAGHAGRVTVATNMAGRGTDIPLGPGVAEAGGLTVLLTERHDSRRIDRQLAGRCARQGDEGTVEFFLSLEDAVVQRFGFRWLVGLARHRLRSGRGRWLAHAAVVVAQRRAEWLNRRARQQVLKADRAAADTLALSGPME